MMILLSAYWNSAFIVSVTIIVECTNNQNQSEIILITFIKYWAVYNIISMLM